MSARRDRAIDPGRRVRRLGVVLWPSFTVAGALTAVCFALFDPLVLRDLVRPEWPMSRGLGYSIGFFLFWAATATSSAMALWLWDAPVRGGASRG